MTIELKKQNWHILIIIFTYLFRKWYNRLYPDIYRYIYVRQNKLKKKKYRTKL